MKFSTRLLESTGLEASDDTHEVDTELGESGALDRARISGVLESTGKTDSEGGAYDVAGMTGPSGEETDPEIAAFLDDAFGRKLAG